MQSLASQFYAFLITIAIGGTLGMLFDIYRVFLYTVRPRKIVNNLGDLLFWIIASIVGFAMLLIGNWGEIRLYVIMGIALGLGVYFKIISDYFVYILERLISIIKKIIRMLIKTLLFCWTVITYPFLLIRNIVIIPVGFLGRLMTRAGKGSRQFSHKYIKKPMKRNIVIFKTKIRKLFKKN